MPNPAPGFGIPDRLGSEADGTGGWQLGTEAFRQQLLPEGQNARPEPLRPRPFGGGFPPLLTSKNPCARPRAAPVTCEAAEPRGEPLLPSSLSPEALCLCTAHCEEGAGR